MKFVCIIRQNSHVFSIFSHFIQRAVFAGTKFRITAEVVVVDFVDSHRAVDLSTLYALN